MKILAHRGLWKREEDKNSASAIRDALDKGFGIESDVRDFCKKLVISHDIATETCIEASDVFRWLSEYSDNYTFAINIKADGLKLLLRSDIIKYNINNYFLFDMSIPQMLEFRDMGLRFFSRLSEIETIPCLYNDASGLWIDGFWTTDWITKDLLEYHLNNNKDICIVSPDLHGQSNYIELWKKIRDYDIATDKIMICTDYPFEARRFFNGTD